MALQAALRHSATDLNLISMGAFHFRTPTAVEENIYGLMQLVSGTHLLHPVFWP